VFENRVLREIFGPKRDEVTGEWRRLHSEELRNLCEFQNIIRHINSKKMSWAGHVARMAEDKCESFLWESPKERDHLKDLGVDGRTGSKWSLGRLVGGGCGVDSPGSG
jgi:hypothetical protein